VDGTPFARYESTVVRVALIVMIATVVACEFRHPARNSDGNLDNDGDVTGDGHGSDGGSGSHGLSTFAPINGVALQSKRSFFAHVIARGQLSVFGGVTDSLLATVEQAPLLANTIGNFQFGTSLHDANSGAVAIFPPTGSDIVYVLGGADTNLNSTTEDQCASVASDGTLSTFAATCAALHTPRNVGGAVLTSNRVYVIGGNDNTTTSTDLPEVETS
jgi:hypothetical protein